MLHLIRLNGLALPRSVLKTTLTFIKTTPVNVAHPIRRMLPFTHSLQSTSTFQRDTIRHATRLQSLSRMILPCMSTVPSTTMLSLVPCVSTMTLSTPSILKPIKNSCSQNSSSQDSTSSNPMINWLAIAAAGLAISAFDGEPRFAETASKRKRTTKTKSNVTAATTIPRYVYNEFYFRFFFIVYSFLGFAMSSCQCFLVFIFFCQCFCFALLFFVLLLI